MLKKMILYGVVALVVLAAALLYPLLRVKLTATVSPAAPARDAGPEIKRLHEHVEFLSNRIGSRSVYEYPNLEEAKKYIRASLEKMGYRPDLQDYQYGGRTYSNVIASLPGRTRPGEVVVIGAHYDTVEGTPGADDNASAVAVLLEMARELKEAAPSRTLKLVFFVLEESPVYNTEAMGSYVYARAAKARGENIRAMISLEMVGYFSDREGDQSYPLPFMGLVYPKTPNFIAVVGDLKSRDLVQRVKASISRSSAVPVETLALTSFVPGVALSDHNSFWKMGYRAVMITDTAFYRNPNYHSVSDTAASLDIPRMADLLKGLVQTARDLGES